MVQTLKEIINYVNSVKGHPKPSFNSESTVNLYDIFIQEWWEHFWKFIEKFQTNNLILQTIKMRELKNNLKRVET